MTIIVGLVDPKFTPNWGKTKGNQVNILELVAMVNITAML